MFSRSTQPTCHLLVGNVGPAVGFERDAITAALAPLGCTHVHVPQLEDKEAAYVFASFDCEDQAAAALEALHERSHCSLGSRVLTAKFAKLKHKEHAAPQEQVHVSRTSEGCGVPGLSLLLEFVSEAEEQELLAVIDASPWETLARRRVQHYGYEFRYLTRDVDPAKPAAPIPPPVAALLGRLQAAAGDSSVALDQLTVNEYAPGVGLSPHVDMHSAFTGAILSLSLAGPAVMQFRCGSERRAIFLPPRSLLVLAGEARYAWDHYIPHRRQDVVDGVTIQRAARRVSLTFRRARGFACDCAFPAQCDSQLQRLPPTRNLLAAQAAAVAHGSANGGSSGRVRSGSGANKRALSGLGGPSVAGVTLGGGGGSDSEADSHAELQAAGPAAVGAAQQPLRVAPAANGHPMAAASGDDSGSNEAACQQMEDRFVNDVYNAIAPHFHSTRFAVWPKVRAFLEGFRSGDILADVGCGNGKYFGVRRDVAILASDRSTGLATVAAKRLTTATGSAAKADVAVADAFALPYRRGSCDGALCIAVLHHISSAARRQRLLQRVMHILRPGGRALVTVWAFEQEEQKLLDKWHRLQQPSQNGASPIDGSSATSSDTGGGAGDDDGSREGAGANSTAASAKRSGGSLDYMVPWHLPFHRLEAAAVAARTTGGGSSRQWSAPGVAAANGAVLPEPEAPFARIDQAKNSIVFDRYYHLFRRGELEALAAEVPGASVADSFYDKSNWCIVLQRNGADDKDVKHCLQ